MKNKKLNRELSDIIAKAAGKISTNDYLHAEMLLQEGRSLDKENPTVLFNLAVVLLKQSRNSEAEEYLEMILALPFSTTDVIQVKTMLCYSYLQHGESKKCPDLIRSIIKVSPNNTTALSLFGYYTEKSNNGKKAIEIYSKILTIEKENLNAHNSFAYLTALYGDDLNSALRSARFCISKNPESAAYCDTIGYIYSKMGETQLASKFLKKALALAPQSEEIRAHLHELLKI